MPLALKNLLQDDNIRKIGLAIDRDDAKRLKEEFGVTMRNVVDVNERAKRYGLAKSGMKNLVERMLGLALNKSAQVSNWGANFLCAFRCRGLRRSETDFLFVQQCNKCITQLLTPT
jgi:ribonuclease D